LFVLFSATFVSFSILERAHPWSHAFFLESSWGVSSADYANGAAPRVCFFPTVEAEAAADEEAATATSDSFHINQSAANGRCQCAGDVMKIGLAPHPATVTVQILQQQQERMVLCTPSMNSLDGACDEDAGVAAATVHL
jgi:hypothetical protein